MCRLTCGWLPVLRERASLLKNHSYSFQEVQINHTCNYKKTEFINSDILPLVPT